MTSLKIPVISILRDSQNFVRAADEGIGICDLPLYRSKADIVSIARIVAWLDSSLKSRAETELKSAAAARATARNLPAS